MTTTYESPLAGRYASEAISHLFSPQFKHGSWRRLWVALAKAQQQLGLPITGAQIEEMERHVEQIDFSKAREYEKQFRHDVMAHIHTFGDLCPLARPIIHMGATSCYVTDNTELIQMREGLEVLRGKLLLLLKQLARFAYEYRDLPCLGFTHFQPAQLTTVGKRACLWLQDFLMDFHELSYRKEGLRFLGVKGTTGTQASFLKLFEGDSDKVKQLDRLVASAAGFDQLLLISGQTYTRKQDVQVLQALAGFGASAHKMATDLRLLANLKEMEEPFEKDQIGSSAMPYKRNPMRSERLCALSRFLISLSENPLYTAATQWLERTLDDSANRRLAIAEAFLTADACLNLLLSVTDNLIVYPRVIQARIDQELPFMATENLLMLGVSKGGDRQDLHAKLRAHSLAAAKRVKEEGASNDLLARLINDPEFPINEQELEQALDVKAFIGRAPEQVEEFLSHELEPVLQKHPHLTAAPSSVLF